MITDKSEVMHVNIWSVVWMFSAVRCTNLDAPHSKLFVHPRYRPDPRTLVLTSRFCIREPATPEPPQQCALAHLFSAVSPCQFKMKDLLQETNISTMSDVTLILLTVPKPPGAWKNLGRFHVLRPKPNPWVFQSTALMTSLFNVLRSLNWCQRRNKSMKSSCGKKSGCQRASISKCNGRPLHLSLIFTWEGIQKSNDYWVVKFSMEFMFQEPFCSKNRAWKRFVVRFGSFFPEK